MATKVLKNNNNTVICIINYYNENDTNQIKRLSKLLNIIDNIDLRHIDNLIELEENHKYQLNAIINFISLSYSLSFSTSKSILSKMETDKYNYWTYFRILRYDNTISMVNDKIKNNNNSNKIYNYLKSILI